MSKTLEELGYKKTEDDTVGKIYLSKDKTKKLFFGKLTHRLLISLQNHNYEVVELSMEELKAIYKCCEDNKWI